MGAAGTVPRAGCVPTSAEAEGAPSGHSPSQAVSEGPTPHSAEAGGVGGLRHPSALSSQCTADKLATGP